MDDYKIPKNETTQFEVTPITTYMIALSTPARFNAKAKD